MCELCNDKNRIFEEKARKVHGDKYDYSKVEYVNSNTKVCIICPEHGEFWQFPSNHFKGSGCPICGVIKRSESKRKRLSEFIEEAHKVHGDKYDYSKVEYKTIDDKICIICPEHGEFWQIPFTHLKGTGCPKCAYEKISTVKKRNKEWFVEKAHQKHGDKYDYSKVEYKGIKTKVCIICPTHGEFWQTPDNHIQGKGCSKCANTQRSNTEEFIEKAKKIHGNRYDYNKTVYVDSETPVCIICPIHGEFWQRPSSHLAGRICYKCSINNRTTLRRSNTEEFIEKARKVHGDKYDYSKVDYIDCDTKVCIICPKHGEFWQTPDAHLAGKGCQICKESHMEREIRLCLLEKGINFIYQCKFEWLGNKSLDFYLPDYNIAIECQGRQHYEPVKFGKHGHTKGTLEENLRATQKRDYIKRKQCEENNIKIIYIKYDIKDKSKYLMQKLKSYETQNVKI